MLKTFFFVPANNIKFIIKSKKLNTDFIIFDLEDSVLKDELDICIQNLLTVKLEQNQYIRFRFFDENSNLNEDYFKVLLQMGFRQFMIPKFSGLFQVEAINLFLENQNLKHEVTFILLIEDPLGLLTINDVLKRNLIKITAISFGSHDYCNIMGMKHTNTNLYFAKQIILNNAKAYNILALDTVSVNLGYDDEFKEDSLLAFEMGFDGKLVIHPHQLDLLKEINYYTQKEVEEAEKVYSKIMEISEHKTAVVRIDGKIYEKPHINRIINILKWKHNYGIQ